MAFTKFQNGLLAAGAVVLGVFATSDAEAQMANVTATTFPSTPVVTPYYPYYGGYGGTVVGGTAGGSYNFGTGVGIDAAYAGLGEYNYKTGMGLQYREAARKQYIENTVEAVEAFYDRRRVHDIYAVETQVPPLTAQAGAEIARRDAARRLDVTELNAATGKINWPAPLMDERFDGLREQVEELFASRAPFGGQTGRTNAPQIRSATDEMVAVLKSATFDGDERVYSTNEYLAAKNFLDSLRREASHLHRQGMEAVALN